MIKRAFIPFVIFFVILLSRNSNLFAQQLDFLSDHKPKIGLVLSGGGAKGLAHVGVLKVLEELDIRPDYITGVSMGSIVGGLYSIGYSAHELDSLVLAINWQSVFSDEVSFDKVGINSKTDYRKYQLNFSGDSIKGIGLPLGVVRGQLISEMFSELCWRTNGMESFDDFPIPFRCLAADIISGKTYLFDSGSLPLAMRASMSIPSAFTPVVKDGLLLVDGGVINNFPVQECIDMGADIIIGVYVGSDEDPKAKDLNSLVKILTQSASFLGIVNSLESMKSLDIKIIPKLSDYGIESFGRSAEIIDLGEKEARSEEVYQQLVALADSLKKFPATPKPKKETFKLETPINSIYVRGLEYIQRDFFVAMSEIKEYSTVNNEQLKNALKKLYSTLLFDKIEYQFSQNEEGMDLIFDVIEKERVQANVSVYYDNFFGAGLLLNASYKHLLINNSKLDMTVDISKYPRANLAYHFIGGKRKRMDFALGLKTQSITIPNYYEFESSVIVRLGQFRNNRLNVFSSLGYSVTNNSKFELKAGHINNYFYLQDGLEDMYGIKKVDASSFSLEGTFSLNTLNHPVFPTKGALLNLSYRKILNPKSSYTEPGTMFEKISNENDIVIIDYKQYLRIKQRFSIIPEFTLAYMSAVPFYADKFFLGGSGFNSRGNTFNQAGVQPFQIATDNFIKFGLGVQLKIIDHWYMSAFGESAFFINHAETYSEGSLRLNGQTISGWYSSLAYDSVIGPVKFTISQNTDNNKFYYYFSFGYPF